MNRIRNLFAEASFTSLYQTNKQCSVEEEDDNGINSRQSSSLLSKLMGGRTSRTKEEPEDDVHLVFSEETTSLFEEAKEYLTPERNNKSQEEETTVPTISRFQRSVRVNPFPPMLLINGEEFRGASSQLADEVKEAASNVVEGATANLQGSEITINLDMQQSASVMLTGATANMQASSYKSLGEGPMGVGSLLEEAIPNLHGLDLENLDIVQGATANLQATTYERLGQASKAMLVGATPSLQGAELNNLNIQPRASAILAGAAANLQPPALSTKVDISAIIQEGTPNLEAESFESLGEGPKTVGSWVEGATSNLLQGAELNSSEAASSIIHGATANLQPAALSTKECNIQFILAGGTPTLQANCYGSLGKGVKVVGSLLEASTPNLHETKFNNLDIQQIASTMLHDATANLQSAVMSTEADIPSIIREGTQNLQANSYESFAPRVSDMIESATPNLEVSAHDYADQPPMRKKLKLNVHRDRPSNAIVVQEAMLGCFQHKSISTGGAAVTSRPQHGNLRHGNKRPRIDESSPPQPKRAKYNSMTALAIIQEADFYSEPLFSTPSTLQLPFHNTNQKKLDVPTYNQMLLNQSATAAQKIQETIDQTACTAQQWLNHSSTVTKDWIDQSSTVTKEWISNTTVAAASSTARIIEEAQPTFYAPEPGQMAVDINTTATKEWIEQNSATAKEWINRTSTEAASATTRIIDEAQPTFHVPDQMTFNMNATTTAAAMILEEALPAHQYKADASHTDFGKGLFNNSSMSAILEDLLPSHGYKTGTACTLAGQGLFNNGTFSSLLQDALPTSHALKSATTTTSSSSTSQWALLMAGAVFAVGTAARKVLGPRQRRRPAKSLHKTASKRPRGRPISPLSPVVPVLADLELSLQTGIRNSDRIGCKRTRDDYYLRSLDRKDYFLRSLDRKE